MYITHHFAHPETLSRARSWLTHLGYKPHQIETHAEGLPRLAMSIEPYQLGEVSMLINAVERTDTDGFPSFWDLARQPHVARVEDSGSDERHPVHRTAIGWHPCD
jgi:hypothetical protein